jgi:thiamine pyrophosphokinase
MLRAHARQADVVIATDGAASVALAAGVRATYVVGDFDSISEAGLGAFPGGALIRVEDQNSCDLEKALRYAVGLGCTAATILGGLGRRWDHSLTTLSIAVRFADQLQVRIADPTCDIRTVSGDCEIHGAAGDTVSLIAFAPARGVSISGVRWELSDADFVPGSLGVSNILTAGTARVRVREGSLLVCHLRSKKGRA